jgi:hypothetical protein
VLRIEVIKTSPVTLDGTVLSFYNIRTIMLWHKEGIFGSVWISVATVPGAIMYEYMSGEMLGDYELLFRPSSEMFLLNRQCRHFLSLCCN